MDFGSYCWSCQPLHREKHWPMKLSVNTNSAAAHAISIWFSNGILEKLNVSYQ